MRRVSVAPDGPGEASTPDRAPVTAAAWVSPRALLVGSARGWVALLELEPGGRLRRVAAQTMAQATAGAGGLGGLAGGLGGLGGAGPGSDAAAAAAGAAPAPVPVDKIEFVERWDACVVVLWNERVHAFRLDAAREAGAQLLRLEPPVNVNETGVVSFSTAPAAERICVGLRRRVLLLKRVHASLTSGARFELVSVVDVEGVARELAWCVERNGARWLAVAAEERVLWVSAEARGVKLEPLPPVSFFAEGRAPDELCMVRGVRARLCGPRSPPPAHPQEGIEFPEPVAALVTVRPFLVAALASSGDVALALETGEVLATLRGAVPRGMTRHAMQVNRGGGVALAERLRSLAPAGGRAGAGPPEQQAAQPALTTVDLVSFGASEALIGVPLEEQLASLVQGKRFDAALAECKALKASGGAWRSAAPAAEDAARAALRAEAVAQAAEERVRTSFALSVLLDASPVSVEAVGKAAGLVAQSLGGGSASRLSPFGPDDALVSLSLTLLGAVRETDLFQSAAEYEELAGAVASACGLRLDGGGGVGVGVGGGGGGKKGVVSFQPLAFGVFLRDVALYALDTLREAVDAAARPAEVEAGVDGGVVGGGGRGGGVAGVAEVGADNARPGAPRAAGAAAGSAGDAGATPEAGAATATRERAKELCDSLTLRAFVLGRPGRNASPEATRAYEARKRAFLTAPNACSVDESQRLLLTYPEMWQDHALLLAGKGMHRKALEWIRTLGVNAAKDDDRYARAAIALIQHPDFALRDEASLFELSRWVLERHPQVGVRAFAGDRVDLGKALAYVESVRPGLSQVLLEHLVLELGRSDLKARDALARVYVASLAKLAEAAAPGEEGQLQATRGKLRALLTSPGPLSLGELLPEIQLPQERALVLDRLGRRRDAALVLALHSSADAEAYAASCAEPREAFDVVLRESLRKDPSGESAVGLVERHADKIDLLQAVDALPDHVASGRVLEVLSAELARAASAHRAKSVLKQLLKRENFSALLGLERERAQSFTVTGESRCATCRRPFKGDAAFVRFPDGALRHRACVRDAALGGPPLGASWGSGGGREGVREGVREVRVGAWVRAPGAWVRGLQSRVFVTLWRWREWSDAIVRAGWPLRSEARVLLSRAGVRCGRAFGPATQWLECLGLARAPGIPGVDGGAERRGC